MAKSLRNTEIVILDDEEEDEYSEMENFYSDDSEDDPTYTDNLDKAHSNFANLSIKSRKNATEMDEDDDTDDDDDDDVGEISEPKLGIKDAKDFEEIQRVIECGQVEKLKVDQCKVYLRKHGLRLTGKKDVLIQRIKEHLEILNGGEKKFPPSSFVLNCKGDACMGDIVMFEQTVYEGYSIASRSAIGPPCGKRTVAGRIVKESYGAAKQQHTFTVEVLWSKGHKPLPPLHPLLIKGRNLYKLNTLRQRWKDEGERQRVLNEKHNRGSVARSNREARIQVKVSKKTCKGSRITPKEGQHSREEQNRRHATDHISLSTNTQGSNAAVELKEKSYGGLPRYQPSQQNQLNLPASRVCLAYKDPNSSLPHIGPSDVQHYKPAGQSGSTSEPHCQFPDSSLQRRQYPRYQPSQQNQLNMPVSRVCLAYKDPNSSLSLIGPSHLQHYKPAGRSGSTSEPHCRFPDSSLQRRQYPRPQQYMEYKENPVQPFLDPCSSQQRIPTKHSTLLQNAYGRNHQKEPQQLCRHYPRGKCYYGMNCKFLHVFNSNQC